MLCCVRLRPCSLLQRGNKFSITLPFHHAVPRRCSHPAVPPPSGIAGRLPLLFCSTASLQAMIYTCRQYGSSCLLILCRVSHFPCLEQNALNQALFLSYCTHIHTHTYTRIHTHTHTQARYPLTFIAAPDARKLSQILVDIQ